MVAGRVHGTRYPLELSVRTTEKIVGVHGPAAMTISVVRTFGVLFSWCSTGLTHFLSSA